MSEHHSTARRPFVYFIQGVDGGPIKIGYTSDSPLKRLEGIKTASPVDLKLVAVIRVAGMHDEAELHARFAHIRVRGEWFHPAPELQQYIEAFGKPYVRTARPKNGSGRTRRKKHVRGRPNLADSPKAVARMLKCAKAKLVDGVSRKKLACLYDVCPRTVSYWVRRALEMEGPEGDALRRLAADRQAS